MLDTHELRILIPKDFHKVLRDGGRCNWPLPNMGQCQHNYSECESATQTGYMPWIRRMLVSGYHSRKVAEVVQLVQNSPLQGDQKVPLIVVLLQALTESDSHSSGEGC